jgi:hypothetical protein
MLYERLGENDNAINAYNRIQGSGRFKKRLAQLYLQKNEIISSLLGSKYAIILSYKRKEKLNVKNL